jgi:hypothetical protein
METIDSMKLRKLSYLASNQSGDVESLIWFGCILAQDTTDRDGVSLAPLRACDSSLRMREIIQRLSLGCSNHTNRCGNAVRCYI